MSCDCKKTGRYLGSFERCQVCLEPHYWGPHFVIVDRDPQPLPLASGRLPYPSECEYGFRARHSEHPVLVGHGPDERTAKIDLYKKEKTERLRALAKPAGLTFTMPCGPKVRGAEVARRVDAPRYADGSECKVGDTVRHDRYHWWGIVVALPEKSVSAGHVICEGPTGVRNSDAVARLIPIRSFNELADRLRVGDVIQCVSGVRLRVAESLRPDGTYTLASPRVSFSCRARTVARGLRGGDTIIRREQLTDEQLSALLETQ